MSDHLLQGVIASLVYAGGSVLHAVGQGCQVEILLDEPIDDRKFIYPAISSVEPNQPPNGDTLKRIVASLQRRICP